jgi:transcriptional regulator with XRE-family HTH domain
MYNLVFQYAIKHQNIKQADLANIAGVTPSALSKYIAGQNTIVIDKLLKIAPAPKTFVGLSAFQNAPQSTFSRLYGITYIYHNNYSPQRKLSGIVEVMINHCRAC